MDFERYWGELNEWTPEDEEKRRDQQFYLGIMMQARELDRKERMSDDEYRRNIDLMVDEEQRQQFMNDHISESEYVREMDDIHEVIAEMDRKYGIGQDVIQRENEVEVSRKREELLALQAYYRVMNDGKTANIMLNANFETMSSNDLLDYYERTAVAMSRNGNNFSELVSKGKEILENEERDREEAIKEGYRQQIRDRLEEKGIVRKPTGGTDGEEPSKATDEEKIKEKIEKFKIDSDKMKAEIDDVKTELVLGEENKLFELTDAVRGLETELGELAADADRLKEEIDSFVLETGAADFSMTPAQIEKRVDKLKRGVKELKQKLVSKYDARVVMTNDEIKELKSRTDLEPDVKIKVDELEELPICGVNVKNWKHNKFMADIDFNKLVEVNRGINEIRNRLMLEPALPILPPSDGIVSGGGNDGSDEPPIEDNGLEADIAAVEGAIELVKSQIVPSLTADDIDKIIKQDLQIIADNINDFRLRLESNKDKLSDEEYNNYLSRVEDAEANLDQLYSQLKSMNNSKTDKNQDYDDLVKRADKISVDADKLVDDVVAFHGKVTDGGVLVFEDRICKIEQDLSELKNDIESKYKEGKFDENQYNSLMEKVNDMEKKFVASRTELKEADYIKDADIFAVLNGEIDGLENALTNLEEQVEKLQKPIKREDRKDIDRIVKHLEQEIARLEKFIEKYKESEPDKYNAAMDRLNSLKDRLDKVGKKYRDKCPLMVKAVKSAKNFFKKHKKICLIIAGLAAIALVHATFGPVIIPALMHGNIMIAGTSPVLRPFIKFTNNILGGMIGATKDANGLWWLANGVMINPSCTASSLLKGLAISGIGSTALVAPLVIAIKNLVKKMKTTELKQKLSEGFNKTKSETTENLKNVGKKVRNATVGKINKGNNQNKKIVLKTETDAKKLLEEYRKNSNKMSFEDFVTNKGLSEEELNFLKSYIVMMQKNITEQEEYKKSSASSGRKVK